MGTWDDGLYDNDSALDRLANLVLQDGEDNDATRLVATIGLVAWLNPIAVTHDHRGLGDRARALVGDIEQLPAETVTALKKLLDDPEAVTENGSRTAAAQAAIGGYSDGPRIEALLRFSGAQPVIDELGERAARQLDRVLKAKIDLYEAAGDLAALGVLIELKEAGLWAPERARVSAWRSGFAAIDRATKSERVFWTKYVRRVRSGFEVLDPTSTVPRSMPTLRKGPAEAPAGPIERFSHPKFGAGTLVGRSGTGEAEALELRFDDGEIRKILRRFVTAVA